MENNTRVDKELLKIDKVLRKKVCVHLESYVPQEGRFDPELRLELFNRLMDIHFRYDVLLARLQILCKAKGIEVGIIKNES